MAAPFYNHSGVLIDWKDPGGGFDLAAALSGILALGATGSGKSSGPGATLRKALLLSTRSLPGGCGGVVLCAKPGEADEWEEVCRKLGRAADVIRITPGGAYRFNFLAWIDAFGQGGDRGPLVAVDFLQELAGRIDPAGAGTAQGGDNAFFAGAFRQRLLALSTLIQVSGLPLSIPLLRAIANSSPLSLDQLGNAEWRATSVCAHVLREAETATRDNPAAKADFEECRRHVERDFATLSDRTRSVVDTMFSGLVSPFLTRPLRPLFCEDTTVRVEQCFDGKVLLIDVPVQEYGVVGRLCAQIYKRCLQLAILRRSGPPGSLRPTFVFADEGQMFVTDTDVSYQSVARGSGGITVLMTQNIAGLRDAMGSADKAESLIGNLQTIFICQSTGETASWASKLIGERHVNITGMNIGRGGGVQGGVRGDSTSNAGVSRHEERRSYLESSAFQRLRRGGPGCDYLVDAVVYSGGKLFAGENGEAVPYKLVSFRQR